MAMDSHTICLHQLDALFIPYEGLGGEPQQAPRAALVLLLMTVLTTGVLDGVAQPAVFVDAALAGPAYTHVRVVSLLRPRCPR
jgi:hypothetical protein